MLVKVRILEAKCPKAEVGKERLPVEVIESIMFIDPTRIISVNVMPEFPEQYMDSDQVKAKAAIIAKYGKHPKLCRINTADAWYFGNVFLEDILPHLQINENGLQRNVEGQMS